MAMAPDQNLFGRMTQLKASGKIEKELYHHFQTLRLIGNKAVHSTVLKATTVSKMNHHSLSRASKCSRRLPLSPVRLTTPTLFVTCRSTWAR
jgi:hypothetical protein